MKSPIREAVRLARSAAGNVFPNPLVGAIVVRNGITIGSGCHLKAGDLHAEVGALRQARNVEGATLYVTLEPCAHEGRQPPCVNEIIQSKIKAVVIGALDPNPITSGRGLMALRKAGIDVTVLNDPSSLELIRDFKVWINSSFPYVALKLASSIDGCVAGAPGERLHLTGREWRARVQMLRYTHQAVLVGAGTVLIDDPHLTVEHPARAVPLRRLVVAGRRPLSPKANIFSPTADYLRTVVLFPESERSADWVSRLGAVAEMVPCPGRDGVVDLSKGLQDVRERFGIVSIISEGGPTLAKKLFVDDLVETIFWAYAPQLLASPTSVAAVNPALGDLSGSRFSLKRVRKLGNDVSVEYWRDRVAHV